MRVILKIGKLGDLANSPTLFRLLLMNTLQELQEVYRLPLHELIFQAAEVHRRHHEIADIQRCALLSIKTGGCPEDCAYCAQSARYATGVEAGRLMQTGEVMKVAERAKENGSTRF